ncbi:hypothetical protein F4V43_05885 [Paenibacillus spiritus]|uniref:HesB/YadR/YfhF family protein n=1 Tax=Paenibacillus spiritus TaxID=2496557 RepID=A0A5J5GGI8_9BACL|nr:MULTISPECIES: hypothetical protein [Paenibacillus]KAA9006634.1 hypothetical protein F4V43_05885 [Paenibacillus spiritus]
MSITVSSEAASWFKRELSLQEGAQLRLFPRYSSGGGLHPGFSLGIAAQPAVRPGMQETREGVFFYLEEQDLWYMDGYNLSIVYDKAEDDIDYVYEPASAREQA